MVGNNNRNQDMLMQHFWKVFAVAVATCSLWLVYQFITSAESILDKQSIRATRRPYPSIPQLVMYLRNSEAEPASVYFKNQSPPVTGFIADSDHDFLILSSVSAKDSIEDRILIPWDNVLYIKTRLKQSTSK
jgi:hypothetical protein